MGRPGLTDHRKFKRLARRLGSDILARGALELLWDSSYITGSEYIGGPEDVEISAHWTGPNSELFKALLEAGGLENAGFIEECPAREGHYQIHDFWDHAPTYVKKIAERQAERETRGESLSEARARAGRAGRAAQIEAAKLANPPGQTSDTCPASVGQVLDTCQTNAGHMLGKRGQTSPIPPLPSPPLKEKAKSAFSSSELVPAAEEKPPQIAFVLPCVGNGPHSWPVSEKMLDEYSLLFPGVDLDLEFRKMRHWLETNTKKRKTFRGMRRFVSGWLSRAQDQGKGQASKGNASRTPEADQDYDRQLEGLCGGGSHA
jgi:hypothetical protein